MNYFVPHFGEDGDIRATKESAKHAEKQLGHVWQKPKDEDIKRNYFVPHFGEDKEIRDAKTNIAQQEKLHGEWVVEQDENGFYNVPGPEDNKSYNYRGH